MKSVLPAIVKVSLFFLSLAVFFPHARGVEYTYYPERTEPHPVLKHNPNSLSAGWENQIEKVMAKSEEEILALLPKKAGNYYVHCPNCDKQGQGSSFGWSIDTPDKITCKLCGHSYPSEKYPMDKSVVAIPPSGKEITYHYYQGPDRKHFFGAGLEYRKKKYFESMTYWLALKFLKTGEEKYAERAAVILCGLAKNYPDFAWHYDHPDRDLKFYKGTPTTEQLLPEFYITRWDWWGYMDIPKTAARAYDILLTSKSLPQYLAKHGYDRHELLEKGFLLNAAEGVFLNRERYYNMAPTFWSSALTVGRVAGAPDYVHEVVKRFRHYLNTRFTFDGFWYEPSVSYFSQSSRSAFGKILPLLKGYSDPEGYICKTDGTRFDNLDPERDFAETIAPILETLKQVKYPNGRDLPMSDSWMLKSDKDKPENGAVFEQPSYLNAAVGHGSLCTPANGHQTQLHLFWTSSCGHEQFDCLNLTLWANRREVLSDLGYTHTKYRTWLMASAAHNLVVVDGRNQLRRTGKYKNRGNLLYMDTTPGCQILDVDGSYAYDLPYRRASFLIEKNGAYYIADFFHASGGTTYDYFFHGNAAEGYEDNFSLISTGKTVLQQYHGRIAPDEIMDSWKSPVSEQELHLQDQWYAYGFLRKLKIFCITTVFANVEFRQKDGSGLNMLLATNAEDILFTGKNPCSRIRFDNVDLDKNLRSFVALRKTKKDKGDADFQAVIEPFDEQGKKAGVLAISQLRKNVMLVKFEDGCDIVFKDQKTPIAINLPNNDTPLIINGAYGLVRFTGNKITKCHLVGAGIGYGDFERSTNSILTAKVNRVDSPSQFIFAAPDYIARKGEKISDFVLIRHGDELTHGYFCTHVSLPAGLVNVKGRLGFELTDTGSRLTFYPLLDLSGPTESCFFPILDEDLGR